MEKKIERVRFKSTSERGIRYIRLNKMCARMYVRFVSSRKIIENDHLIIFGNEHIHQMRANKACAAGDKYCSRHIISILRLA